MSAPIDANTFLAALRQERKDAQKELEARLKIEREEAAKARLEQDKAAERARKANLDAITDLMKAEREQMVRQLKDERKAILDAAQTTGNVGGAGNNGGGAGAIRLKSDQVKLKGAGAQMSWANYHEWKRDFENTTRLYDNIWTKLPDVQKIAHVEATFSTEFAKQYETTVKPTLEAALADDDQLTYKDVLDGIENYVPVSETFTMTDGTC